MKVKRKIVLTILIVLSFFILSGCSGKKIAHDNHDEKSSLSPVKNFGIVR